MPPFAAPALAEPPVELVPAPLPLVPAAFAPPMLLPAVLELPACPALPWSSLLAVSPQPSASTPRVANDQIKPRAERIRGSFHPLLPSATQLVSLRVSPRRAEPSSEQELRAVRLSGVPGVTLKEAAARFQVPLSRVRRARKRQPELARLSSAELALAALTNNGLEPEFTFADLARVAAWLDYVNHDGSTEEDVRRLLQGLAEQGLLELGERAGRLLRDWP
jgi:hypothetical protein